jgi:hypothetical protein
LLQGVFRWPAQHGTGGVKTRAVAGTIPGAIGLVPADEAFEMGADWGTYCHVAFVIALRCELPPMQAHNFPFAFFHVVEGVRFSASETVAQ